VILNIGLEIRRKSNWWYFSWWKQRIPVYNNTHSPEPGKSLSSAVVLHIFLWKAVLSPNEATRRIDAWV
jgi:hypothetical protein